MSPVFSLINNMHSLQISSVGDTYTCEKQDIRNKKLECCHIRHFNKIIHTWANLQDNAEINPWTLVVKGNIKKCVVGPLRPWAFPPLNKSNIAQFLQLIKLHMVKLIWLA